MECYLNEKVLNFYYLIINNTFYCIQTKFEIGRYGGVQAEQLSPSLSLSLLPLPSHITTILYLLVVYHSYNIYIYCIQDIYIQYVTIAARAQCFVVLLLLWVDFARLR
jgi:hypothetical protein